MAADPIEELLRLLVSREHLANSLSAERRAMIRELFGRIEAIFRTVDPPGPTRTRYRRDRTERALREIQAELRKVAPELERAMRDDLARIGRDMGVRAQRSIIASLGTEAPDLFSVEVGVTQARLRAILRTDPIQGRTLREHTRTWAATTYNRVRDQIRLGMTAEESTEDIMRRVIGTQTGYQSTATGRMRKTPGPRAVPLYRGGVYTKAARDAEAIVRTAVTHTSNMGMLETFRANETVLDGVEYVATLDDRTCFVAGTEVLTPAGQVPIERLRPGDLVVGGTGQVRRVEGTRESTSDDLVRVTLSNGETVECTADHLWLTASQEWVEARSLTPGLRMAQRLDTAYLTGHGDLSSVRRDVRRAEREGEQVLRPSVLPSRPEAGRLYRDAGDEDSVRHLRPASRADQVQEARRIARRSCLLLTRMLPGAPLEAGNVDMPGVRGGAVGHALPGEDAEVLLSRVSCGVQASGPYQLPGVRSALHSHSDPAQDGIRRLQERSDHVLRRLLRQVGQRGRGTETEDRRSVPWRETPELEGRPVLSGQGLPWAGVEANRPEDQGSRRASLHEVRSDGRGEREAPVGAPHRSVSQFRVGPDGQSPKQPDDTLSAVSHDRGVEGSSCPAADPPPTVLSVARVDRATTVYDIQVERDHSFIVAGVVVHNSVLCASLDGKVWPLDSDEIVIPGENTHYGCRSVLAPVPAWERLGLDPPPEGTRIARDLRGISDAQLDQAVSTRRRTSGFGDVEKIPSSVIAEEWLRQQRQSVQKRVLGARRAELFRAGDVSLAEMIRSDNTLIPLDQLLGG